MSIFDRLNGGGPGNMQDMMNQVRNNPLAMARQAGYKIPENLAGNPQAMVQHLIQTGQVGGPAMQRIMPMIRQLTGR